MIKNKMFRKLKNYKKSKNIILFYCLNQLTISGIYHKWGRKSSLRRKKFSWEENFFFIKVFFTFLHFLCAGLHFVTTVHGLALYARIYVICFLEDQFSIFDLGICIWPWRWPWMIIIVPEMDYLELLHLSLVKISYLTMIFRDFDLEMYDKKHLDELLVRQHIQKWTQCPQITIKNDSVPVKSTHKMS